MSINTLVGRFGGFAGTGSGPSIIDFTSGPLDGTSIDLSLVSSFDFPVSTHEFTSTGTFGCNVDVVGAGGGGGGAGNGVDTGPFSPGGSGGAGVSSSVAGPNITTVNAGGGTGGSGGQGTDSGGGPGGTGSGGTASGGDTNVSGNFGTGGTGGPGGDGGPGNPGGNAGSVYPAGTFGSSNGGSGGGGEILNPNSPPNGGNSGGGGGGAGGGSYATKQFTILAGQTYTVQVGSGTPGSPAGPGFGFAPTGGSGQPGLVRISKTS